MVKIIRWGLLMLSVLFLPAGFVCAQTGEEKPSDLPGTKEVTAEALAQALKRSETAKEYLKKSEEIQQEIQNASSDKRSALKAMVGVDIALLWAELDFFTLLAYQANMEATSASEAVAATKEKTDS